MWLKAQATQLQSYPLLCTCDLKKVMSLSVSTRAQGCLSGMGDTHSESLRFTVRTSLSLPLTNKALKVLHVL